MRAIFPVRLPRGRYFRRGFLASNKGEMAAIHVEMGARHDVDRIRRVLRPAVEQRRAPVVNVDGHGARRGFGFERLERAVGTQGEPPPAYRSAHCPLPDTARSATRSSRNVVGAFRSDVPQNQQSRSASVFSRPQMWQTSNDVARVQIVKCESQSPIWITAASAIVITPETT